MGTHRNDQPGQKGRYHHGDLREALISATRELVAERGAENFSLADACRVAGVSTAAPYRHFEDKLAILAEITARGFDRLTEKSVAAVARHGAGTLAGIVAMGQAYVEFAVEDPATFRLMFGQNPALKDKPMVDETGQTCFGYVIEQVRCYCEQHGLERDARAIATTLWTFVHGMASLTIEGDYEKVVPDVDLNAVLSIATQQMLSPTAQ